MTMLYISYCTVAIVIIALVIGWSINDYKKRFKSKNFPSYNYITTEEYIRFMQEAKENDKLGNGET